jgi:hypothetical protein
MMIQKSERKRKKERKKMDLLSYKNERIKDGVMALGLRIVVWIWRKGKEGKGKEKEEWEIISNGHFFFLLLFNNNFDYSFLHLTRNLNTTLWN